jgi:hypothetical protein
VLWCHTMPFGFLIQHVFNFRRQTNNHDCFSQVTIDLMNSVYPLYLIFTIAASKAAFIPGPIRFPI